jgi:DNA-binding MarR family transcriptional regulator
MPPPDRFTATLREWVDIFMCYAMRNTIRYAKDSGLSMSQIGALSHINFRGSSGVSDVGDHLGVTSAAASQMLDLLVQQGLVLRTEDPNDRRVKQIVLTPKGQQILQESLQARQGWMDELVERLTDEEKEQLTAALQLLIAKTKQLKEPSK